MKIKANSKRPLIFSPKQDVYLRKNIPYPFYKTGTDTREMFRGVPAVYSFDVLNPTSSFLMLTFEYNDIAQPHPSVVRLAPKQRTTVKLSVSKGIAFPLRYAVSLSSEPFRTHTNRYRAYSDGETVMIVPTPSNLFAAMQSRTQNILRDSRELVTDKSMPSDTYIYTPGPFYKSAGLFARDLLYQMEGSGRDTITAEEVKRAVDYLALKQLTENRKVGPFTYPKGAVADHVYPDGRYSWGPGRYYGDDIGHFNRPSMDEAMCFITLAWHYGYKADWDDGWQTWFRNKAGRFEDAWNSVPRNPKTKLVTQWTTPDHIGANGIMETTGACVMWGFHDSYGFGGDDVGTSVLACNAARALADMYDHASQTASEKQWSNTAETMRDAIRAQFDSNGFLPWGVGTDAPRMASPDITGYAVWSGILSRQQGDAASDWLADCYHADKSTKGPADLFHMTAGFRGAVRMARKTDDVSPGRHVWPDMTPPHWENLAYGYNAYQDGGYWYYMSLGVATTLWRKHPAEAKEWVTNAYTDVTDCDGNPPYERIDGMTPNNNRYNASIGPLLGMAVPAETFSLDVTILEH